jgi:hypothetical protein
LKQPVILGLRDAAKQFVKRSMVATGYRNNLKLMADCFGFLAIELRLEIAAWLPTKDYLDLRSSSRAMVPLFDLQLFWKSRFRINGDRGFLNGLLVSPKNNESKNWRLIYKATARINKSDGHLWELRRRWQNVRWLKERCFMTRTSDDEIASQMNLFSLPRKSDWKECPTEFRCDRHWNQGIDWTLCNNCHAEHFSFVQTVVLDSSIVRLAISVLREGAQTYITGFELISADIQTRNVNFGSRVPGEQVVIEIQDTKLRGFTLLTGKTGIHAIRPNFDTTSSYVSWIGQPGGCNVNEPFDISLPQDIKVLWGNFDVSHLCAERPICSISS